MRLTTVIILICFASLPLAGQDNTPAPDTQVPAQSPTTADPASPPQVHPAATVYSHGYEVRRDIHKYASFATLPLFAAEFALGQSLYNSPVNDSSKSGLHAAVGTGIIGLAGVNTLTGAWNLLEARHDTNGRTLRTLHGVLMMASDAGFVATVATAPSHGRHGMVTFSTDKVTHRNIAVASISVGTAGYLLMLFRHH